MCGIVGWLSASAGTPVEAGVLSRMRDEVAHRGPDGVGDWISSRRDAGLGFRRLAIVDLAPNACQPMANEDAAVQVVFNGEIYNHLTLRRELVALGHRFRTDHSDTETIVHGYEQWGENVVHRLDGKFAIGIWDDRTRQLMLARDRVGVKPLYFARIGPHFLFGSELKSLFAHPAASVELDPAAVYHYLSFLTTPAPLTLYRGFFKLPAGCRAFVRPGEDLRIERYWDALPASGIAGELSARGAEGAEWARGEIVERLDDAVNKRLMSDVPLGVLLSGGVDSSAIVALMSRHVTRPVRTFTVGFSDHERLNELEHAHFVSRTFGTEHHEVMVNEQAMRDYLPQLVYSQDEPIADWVCIPLYFVSKLVRDSGTIVVQVGEGSDEQFCGYDSYMAYLRLYDRYWRAFRRLPARVQRTAAAMAAAASGALDRGYLYTDIAERAAGNREHFWGGAMAFWESHKRLIVGPRLAQPSSDMRPGFVPSSFSGHDTHGVVSHLLGHWDRQVPGGDVLGRMTYLEFKQRLPELLLMRVDKISMSTSIEARVPFLDPKLVEFTMALPRELKIGPGAGQPKKLLKDALRGLVPDQVLDRPKMGFGAPMREWLRGEFGLEAEATIFGSRLAGEGYFRNDRVREMFRQHRAGRDVSLQLWTIYNLTACYDRWVSRDWNRER
jgi:asparagine synthase (glutamine-hydrolysing)